MKGDFTRNTSDPKKHYRDVLLQQGRVLVDADFNEQAALTARRDETTTADIIGDCGGPADDAAFGVSSIPPVGPPSSLPPVNTSKAAAQSILPVILPTTTSDFLLSAGRYYVDGIQCENEQPVRFTTQPDRLDVGPLPQGSYLLYLDVWHRHLTALEDGRIREPALGGPDHGTRVKTIWQVRALDLATAGSPGVIQGNPCGSGADLFKNLADPGTARLTAGTATQPAPKDPCLIPPGAGYTGLENQLYRVEIHDPGSAFDAGTVTGTAVTLPSGNAPKNEITVTGTWAVGNVVEIYPSQTNSPKMKGQLARITKVNGTTLTLNIPVTGFVAADAPKLRKISGATWKWSRENGSVVTRIEKINLNKITVSSLGPDKNLGFAKDAWVEILDDALELESKPGQLAQIDDVDEATRIITLKSVASSLVPAGFSTSTYPNGIVPGRHPKLRRWEGVAAVKFVADPNTNWLPLESGIQVRFANGSYRTGHYWQIPARAATAQSPVGDIEWPVDNTNRLALAPGGITHHFCRLGIVTVKADGSIETTDCRCLYSPLTHPELRSVGGDGQEVMPDLTPPNQNLLVPLPQPISVYVRNLQCTGAKLKLRFKVTPPSDKLILQSAPTNVSNAQGVLDVPAAVGIVRCEWRLDPQVQPLAPRKVEVSLIDASNQTLVSPPPPIFFTANLSIASQVAYNPKGCAALQGQKTVQDAMAHLAALVRIDKVGGDGQDTDPGQPVPNKLIVRVSNKCGPVDKATVTFTVVEGFVDDLTGIPSFTTKTVPVPTDSNGIAECLWRTAAAPNTQQLRAEITQLPATPPGLALGAHRLVLFTANLRPGKDCCVTVGAGGDFADLNGAISELKAKRLEICICLLPGDHIVSALEIVGATASALPITGGTTADALPANVETTASAQPATGGTTADALSPNVETTARAVGTNGGTVSPVLRHLHIHGCGRASRILLGQTLTARSLASIALQDLCIYADVPVPRPNGQPTHEILIEKCKDVTITGCHLRQKDTGNDWIVISEAERIHIADNVIESSVTITFQATDTAVTEAAPSNVRVIAETAAANLADKKKSERAAFIKEFRKIVKEIPDDDPKKKPLAAALKHLGAKSSLKRKSAPAGVDAPVMASIETPQGLADSVIGFVGNSLTFFTPALVIADAKAETAIVNNIIKGDVRFYGMQKRLDPASFNEVARGSRERSLVLSPNPHDAKIEGNSLTEITVDKRIGEVLPLPVLNPKAAQLLPKVLDDVFNRLSLLNNTFSSSFPQFPQNEWLALNVISNGNHFVPGWKNLGTAVGASFICMGTSADIPSTLQYGVPDPAHFQASANLITLNGI